MSQAQLLPSSPALSFPPLTYQGIPVLTTDMLARAYGVEEHQIRQNFKNNRERFIEGKHFFSVSGQKLKDFRLCVENFYSQISSKVRVLVLWTDRGCARHAKSLNTDKAWDMYELLEETFFAVVKTEAKSTDVPLTLSTTASRKPLEKLLKVWASQSGTPHAQCWTMLNAAFNLQRVTELPEAWIPDAIAWVQAKIDALPPAPEQKALPAVPSPSASFLSAADIAALEAAGQRVIALSAYVHREIHELHVEILNVLDIRRMPAGRWRAMSSHIWYSLLDAVNIAPESLTRDTVTGREDRNPAYWTLEMLKDMPAA